eukprot:gene36493-44271_t
MHSSVKDKEWRDQRVIIIDFCDEQPKIAKEVTGQVSSKVEESVFDLFIRLSLSQGEGGDLSLAGLFTVYNTPKDERNIRNIYAKCFEGIGYETCVPNLPDDDLALEPLLPYYRSLASFVGEPYCLSCCGTPQNFIDTWDLSCEVDQFTRTKGNVYGFEARLARHRIESFESETPLQVGDSFREIIVMEHIPQTYPSLDPSKLFFIALLAIALIYVFLYWCRRKRLVGAEPPDPVLLKMLEEKGAAIQGELPERFPGARACTSCIRGIWNVLCCCFIRKAKIKPSLYEEAKNSDVAADGTMIVADNNLEEGKSSVADMTPNSKDKIKDKKKKKKWFRKRENPNILYYEDDIIGSAVRHLKYAETHQVVVKAMSTTTPTSPPKKAAPGEMALSSSSKTSQKLASSNASSAKSSSKKV